MGTKRKSKAYTNFEGSSMRQAGDVVYSNVPIGHAGLLRPECSFHLELSACSFRMITSCFCNYVFFASQCTEGQRVNEKLQYYAHALACMEMCWHIQFHDHFYYCCTIGRFCFST